MKASREADQGKKDGQSPLEELRERELTLEADLKVDGHDRVRFVVHRMNLPSPAAEGGSD